MIDTRSDPGSWERAIRHSGIPVTEYAPAPLHYPADQRGEGGKVRGFDQFHEGAMQHD